MRCSCCDKILNDYESTLKHTKTGEYVDICIKCLKFLPIPVEGRIDLENNQAQEDEEDFIWEGQYSDWEDDE